MDNKYPPMNEVFRNVCNSVRAEFPWKVPQVYLYIECLKSSVLSAWTESWRRDFILFENNLMIM